MELLHLGLSDFVLKDNLTRLPASIRRVLDMVNERNARRDAEAALRKAQAATFEEQRQARLAALNLMEDALAARASAEAAHAELKESEAKYRLLAENSADCIFWVGPDECFKYISPACIKITGYTPEEFLADPGLMNNIIHPDDRAAYRQALADSLRVEEVGIVELRILHRDKSIRWIDHHSKPIFGENGEFLGRHGAKRDITQRKEMDAALRKSKDLLQSVLENVPARVFWKDRDSRYLGCNS